MRSYNTCRALGRTKDAADVDPCAAVQSGPIHDRSKDQNQRRQILQTVSNKLKNELSAAFQKGHLSKSGNKPRGRYDGQEGCEAEEGASEGPELPDPNCVDDEVQEDMADVDRATSPSLTLTDTSDYTMSSVSVDDQGSDPASEGPGSSFNDALGQWDLLGDASCDAALVSTGGEGCQVEAADGRANWTSADPPNEHRTCIPSDLPTENCAGTTKGPDLKETRSSQLGCPSGEEGHSVTARENFDVVYDVFYQDDDGFALIATEDLHHAKVQGMGARGNRDACPNGGSATPPLERVDSPEISLRSKVTSLPSMSTCRSEAEEFMSYSCQGLRSLPGTFARISSREEDEELLSFSRRDLVVLRQSLRDLQVDPTFIDRGDGLPDGGDYIQEDLAPSGVGLLKAEEEEELIQGGHEQENGVGKIGACHEMFTNKERNIRPLSAARVSQPLSSGIGLQSRQPRSNDVRESCLQLVGTTQTKPQSVLHGAQQSQNLTRESIFRCENDMNSGFSPRQAVRQSDPRSRGSSHGSYATPRTGISTEDLEFSELATIVPSRPEVCDVSGDRSILELLSAKVQMLDVTQQKCLLRVLSKIERAKISGNLNIPSMFASLERHRVGVSMTSSELEGAPKTSLLILRLLSTWGDTKCVGLVEVDLFDNTGKKVELEASNVSLHGNTCWDTTANEILPRIINGIVSTTRDRNMWLCPLPPPGCSPLEVHIQVPSPDIVLGHLKIWNYNRSINDIGKGVKEVQVYVDEQLVWQGVVAKGCGNQVFEYSTRIPLLDETPTTVTASSTHSRANCALHDAHFTANTLQADCKVHTCSNREVPGVAPISVGTSFTFSLIEGSSASSICGILSCPSSSSASGEQDMLTSSSLLNVRGNGQDLANETCFATVDGEQHQLKGPDQLASTASEHRSNLSSGRYEGAIENRDPDDKSLPMWLEGSLRKEHDAGKLQENDVAGSTEVVEDCNFLARIGMAGDDILSGLPLPADLRDRKLSVGRRNPKVMPRDINGNGVMHNDNLGSDNALPMVGNKGDTEFASPEGKSARRVLFQKLERNEEKGAVSDMGSPRKHRLLHSAFSGLRKVVVRLKLGLRLTSKEEPAGKGCLVDDLALNPTMNSLLPNSGTGRPKFQIGLGSKTLSLSGHSAPKGQPELAIAAPAAPGAVGGEMQDEEVKEEDDVIEHFETPGVMGLRNEMRESWDSLGQFKAAQLADTKFYSSFISCQQLYDSATQSPHLLSLGSDGAGSPPCPSNPHRTEMMYRTQMELENLQCKEGDALFNPYNDDFGVGNGFSLDFIDAELRRLDEETSDFELSGEDEDMFTIPVLPTGQVLIVNIISTWGDPHYVGLAGIELFDGNGQLIELSDPLEQVQADPPDVNILPGYKDDPRTVDKLVDNVNMTCDDYHVWLTPFTPGKPHLIKITLDSPTTLGMLRFWNYNKSRIHSFRGARMVEITFDRNLIFIGELGKASGSLIDAAQRAEPILFTTNEEVLSAIEQYDQRYHREYERAQESTVIPSPRPSTSGRRPEDISFDTMGYYPTAPHHGVGGRPPTHPIRARSCIAKDPYTLDPDGNEQGMTNGRGYHQKQFLIGEVLTLRLLGTWGDPHYIGLTGIQVLDPEGAAYLIGEDALSARPRDLNDIPGCTGDHRTLDKLVDGSCVTTSDRHMWLIPFDGVHSEHWLKVDLDRPEPIAALKIWNYNKNFEDTCRGVKWLQVLVDDLEVSPPGGELVRKAPGTDIFDFGHLLPLHSPGHTQYKSSQAELLAEKLKIRERANQKRSHNDFLRQEFETPLLPCGHIIKVVLRSTWGDQHYMGLNGMELYDEAGRLLPLSTYNVHASPSSINELPGVSDVRTLDKLFDGKNNTWDDHHMWLTLYEPGKSNQIYFVFEHPVMLSVLRVWNYSKTPARGVSDFEVFVDDLLIYKGYLKQAPPLTSMNRAMTDFSQSIIFTNDEAMVQSHRSRIYFTGDIEHTNVVLINEHHIESSARPSQQSVIDSRPRPPTGLSGLRSH